MPEVTAEPGLPDVVRGEMQPWTDLDHGDAPSGAVLQALVELCIAPGTSVLVAGPHAPDLVEAALRRTDDVTVLVRSVSDAAGLQARQWATAPRVVAGALDGLVAELAGRDDSRFGAVLALDGLDRLLGADSPDLDWPDRLALLCEVLAPQAVLALAGGNAFSVGALLDPRSPSERHGDEEWAPLHSDPSRPASPAALAAALAEAWVPPTRVLAGGAARGRQPALLDVAQGTGSALGTRVLARALDEGTRDRPRLAPVTEAVQLAARAGALASVAECWVAVCGAEVPELAAELPGGRGVVLGTLTGTTWSLDVRSATATESTGLVSLVPDVLPAEVPDQETVGSTLLRLAEAEDVPGFRELADRLGEWARTTTGGDPGTALLLWDDVVPDGHGFARTLSAWCATGAVPADVLLALAWRRLARQLLVEHRRHPWPPWMTDEDLAATWLGMSGEHDPGRTALARGGELLDALDRVDPSSAAAPPDDLRSRLVEDEALRTELIELRGHVFGLERTLGFRDQQLRSRDDRIRELRRDALRAQGTLAGRVALVADRAATVKEPKEFARALKRRGKRLARRVLRR